MTDSTQAAPAGSAPMDPPVVPAVPAAPAAAAAAPPAPSSMAAPTIETSAAVKTSTAARGLAQATLRNAAGWPMDWKVYGVCALLCLVLLAWPALANWSSLEFTPASVPTIFGSMMLVALFVERAIEVFIAVWVDRDSAVHEQNLDFWQARQAKLAKEIQALITERNGQPQPAADRLAAIDKALVDKRAQVDQAVIFADDEEKALLPFEVRTKKVSTWVGLVIGTLTSAVGFRFLSQLVNLPAAGSASYIAMHDSGQYQAFIVADVLLTGVVLAGGSKLVHDIFSVYSSFMDSTKKAVQDQSQPNS